MYDHTIRQTEVNHIECSIRFHKVAHITVILQFGAARYFIEETWKVFN
jgi:hypothetical protein